MNRLLDGVIVLLGGVFIYVASMAFLTPGVELPDDALARDIATLERQLQSNPEDIGLLHELATLHNLHGDHHAAIATLKKALKTDSLNTDERFLTLIEISRNHLALGDTGRAYITATRARGLAPDRADAYNRRGDARYFDGLRREAVNEYETAENVEPEHPESYQKRAQILLENGDVERATDMLGRAIEQDPDNAVARRNLAWHYFQNENFERAHQEIQQSVRLDPNDARSLLVQGRILERMGDLRGAMQAYDRAIAADERFAEAYQRKGDLFRQHGDRRSAHQAYGRALSYDRNNANLLALYRETAGPASSDENAITFAVTDANGRQIVRSLAGGNSEPEEERERSSRTADVDSLLENGKDAYRRGAYEQARSDFARAIQQQPDHARAHYYAGRTLEKLKNYDEALQSYDRAAQLDPQFESPLFYAGQLYYQKARFGEAARSFGRALEINPGLKEARYNLAVSLAKNGERDDAIRAYRELLNQDANHWQAALNLAVLLKQTNRTEEALRLLGDAIQRFPQKAELHYQVGEIAGQRGEFDRALVHYDRTLQLQPDHFDAAFNRALAIQKLNGADSAPARQALERARTLRPSDPGPLYELGRIESRAGNTAEAINFFEQVLAARPAHAEAAIEIIPLYVQSEQPERALQVLERARVAQPTHYRLQFNAGNFYLRIQEYNRAREAYRQAIQIEPGRDAAYLNLAISYRRTGEYRAAAGVYRELLGRNAQHAVAHRELGRLMLENLEDQQRGRIHLQRYLELAPDASDAGQIRQVLKERSG
ncbi:MAG: tetratricopeptide repeat protein [Leptospiraceae bacterium]|nr:tetratricopeptide repeat protein [Leptospiraceae bacterium]